MIDFSKYLSPEEHAKFRIKEEKLAARTIIINAIRTNAWTGVEEKTSVQIRFEIGYNECEWIHLTGGPTGYESMQVNDLDRTIKAGGWLACMGTERRYDRLLVPVLELEKIKLNENILRTGLKD